MYCSSCGVAVSKGVSFCNYCGARLPSIEEGLEFREVRPGLLVSAMAGIFVLGLPGIAFIVFMLNAALRLEPQQTMAFTWVILLLLVALELVFLFLLLRRKPRKEKPREDGQLKPSQTKELERGMPEPVPSVTEHTTRAFEPIGRERS